MSDEQAMRRAIELALRGRGAVSPNPLVGCVLLRDSTVIAEGWHANFGDAHAEAMALQQVTGNLSSATLVCTLEPCSHFGRNPPCADLIINSGIRRVVVGCLDPNPLVSGRGIARMRDAGIEVIENVLTPECTWLNRFFLKSIVQHTPYVLLKVAQSIDGRVSGPNATRIQISSEQSMADVHRLRAECDAVIVGADTAMIDDPQLTVRFASGRNPRRVLIDSQLRCPPHLKMLSDEHVAQTIICCADALRTSDRVALLKARGIAFVFVEQEESGHLNICKCLQQLYAEQDVCSVLVEAGPTLSAAFLRSKCVDELHLYVAPMLLGSGAMAFQDDNDRHELINQQFELHSVHQRGADCHILMTTKP